jgi:serine/threonine-protein kinase
MQPSPKEVGKPHALPTEGEGARADDETTPVPGGDSSESSWESLGSTRVIEGNTPHVLPRASAERPEPESDSRRDIMPRTGKVPVSFGDFELVSKIGEGAMGAVYKARQLSFRRDVALKVLFPHIANNPKLVERLYREGRVMGQLDHSNIVQAFEVNEFQGWHYVAQEYVNGQSMQKWLAHLGRVSIGDALHIVLVCARALEYAHNLGFVHRDIKPDNILIDVSGIVKVADLGMVKVEEENELTQTGHAVGTPWYMPLEQAKNAKDTDGRSDIYALGCMLYCFLTGMPPFAGKTLLEVIRAKDLGTFPPARQANPDVPERLDLIIIKMTSKQPKHRYQTCAELIKDLESLQLAHPRLEFLAHKSVPIDVASTKAPSSHDDPRPVAVTDPNTWYVRVKDAEGNTEVHKLATAQVQSMLNEDLLPPNAKASHDREVGFRALATYKEFHGVALVKASKQSADQHAERYRSLYRKIEEEAEQREREKEIATVETHTPDWVPLAIKIGAGAFGFLLLIWFISWLSR